QRHEGLEQPAQDGAIARRQGQGGTFERSRFQQRVRVNVSRRAARAGSTSWCFGPWASAVRWLLLGSHGGTASTIHSRSRTSRYRSPVAFAGFSRSSPVAASRIFSSDAVVDVAAAYAIIQRLRVSGRRTTMPCSLKSRSTIRAK